MSERLLFHTESKKKLPEIALFSCFFLPNLPNLPNLCLNIFGLRQAKVLPAAPASSLKTV